jgi:hypothetical protein
MNAEGLVQVQVQVLVQLEALKLPLLGPHFRFHSHPA